MFESRHQAMLPRRQFYFRIVRSIALGLALVGFSLAVGMIGYHGLDHLPWIDAFLNSAMIMSGMGPVDEMHTRGAKIFAGCYALYCGIALLSTAAVIFAPVLHRLMHRFHLEEDRNEK